VSEDPRLAAARYRMRRELGDDAPDEAEEAERAARRDAASAADRAAYVEVAIQQAIRRGEFDDLPGAGKPLEGLTDRYDPDWWIRRKIEREQLRGLGPPALTLRVEAEELTERLDALLHEDEVREVLEDFNRRVRVARMQLLGGPPVLVRLRDVDAEVAAWRERRAARAAERRAAAEAAAATRRRRPRWWRRR